MQWAAYIEWRVTVNKYVCTKMIGVEFTIKQISFITII